MSEQMEARILRYLEGQASPEEREVLERELSASPRLRKDLEEARRGLSAMQILSQPVPPPAVGLADETLSELRGRPAGGSPARRWLRRAAAIALLLLLPASGWVARGMVEGRPNSGPPLPSPRTTPGGIADTSPIADGRVYMLLFLGSWPDEAELTPQERAEREASYGGWMTELEARGNITGGGEFGPAPGLMVTNGTMGVNIFEPAVAPEDRIVGFLILRAADEEEARELAAGSPHLQYGGSHLLKPINP